MKTPNALPRKYLGLATLVSVATLEGCGPGAPARIALGHSGEVVIHSQRPTALAAAVFDGDDLIIADAPVSYRHAGGDPISLSPDGTVRCDRAADARIAVSTGDVQTTVTLRCRPVRRIRMVGPVQFLVGDTAQALQAEVLGLDGKPLDRIAGTVSIDDRSIAGAEGMRITPRRAGAALVTLTVGDSSATVGVHVYEPLDALVRLRADQKFVAVPLSLRSGEYRRWTLPGGTWMLTMLPYRDETRGIRLRVEGANCMPVPLTPRRISCHTEGGASITVEHPSKQRAPEMVGQLLVRRI